MPHRIFQHSIIIFDGFIERCPASTTHGLVVTVVVDRLSVNLSNKSYLFERLRAIYKSLKGRFLGQESQQNSTNTMGSTHNLCLYVFYIIEHFIVVYG